MSNIMAASNNMAEGPPKHPMVPGTPAEDPVLKKPASAAPAVEQKASVHHQNHPEASQGPTASIPGQLRQGKLFAWFELLRELEIGSTGEVWLAEDYSSTRQVEQVALKFLPEVIVGDKRALEDLKNVIRRRIALQHPKILRVYGLVEAKGTVAIQMEHRDGQSLSQLRLTKPNRIFEVRDLQKWVNELCQALVYAHKEVGLISGGLEPGDLIVDHDGNLKLKDFGIANSITDSMSRLMVVHHPGETLPYQSPQRAVGKEPAIADDLYSLGAILYELLTGKAPFFDGDVGAQVSGKIPPSMTERRAELGIKGQAIPKNWEETVAACLAKDPAQRPQSAAEVEKRLQNVPARPASEVESVPKLKKTKPRLKKAKPQPPARTPPTRKPWLTIASIIFVLAIGTAIAFFSLHHWAEPELGRIVLKTIPASADVYLDGASRGATPLVIENVAPGDHQLRIELRGYRPQKLIVTIRRGDQESFHLIHLVREGEFFPTPIVAPSVSPTPSPEVNPTPSPAVSPTPSPAVSPTPSPEVSSTPSPVVSSTPSPVVSSTPSPQATITPIERQGTGTSSTPLSQHDIDATKEEVLKRINALPGISAEKKANLIEKMHKARSMERLIVIPFESGRIALRRTAADELVKAFSKPEMRDKLSDPTLILVVAGYADTGGRADANLRISQERAENVTRILKEQAMLFNAMQTIGMGGTELLDSTRPEQNRAVEVWAVVPF
jgi:serine/threonine protein kinase